MKSLIIIIIGLFFSFYFVDLSSANILFHGIAPIGVIIFIGALCVWFTLREKYFGKTVDGGCSAPADGGQNCNIDIGGGDGGC